MLPEYHLTKAEKLVSVSGQGYFSLVRKTSTLTQTIVFSTDNVVGRNVCEEEFGNAYCSLI